MLDLIEKLSNSNEPSVRWKIQVNVLEKDRSSAEIQILENEIAHSPRVKSLLQRVDASGRLVNFKNVYDKWQGTHWVLLSLADLGYPKNRREILPLAEDLFSAWLSKRYFTDAVVEREQDVYRNPNATPVLRGLHRTCASQQGNALYSLLRLGIEDNRLDALAERLMTWQWPDGGWNCDKNPDAKTSTFVHTLWSMRALGLYAQKRKNADAWKATLRAAEFFLERSLFRSRRTGQILREEFLKLHYPRYWHYDILGALKAFAEIGIVDDHRLKAPLELLMDKELISGGWCSESKYYKKASSEFGLGNDYVDWGGASKKVLNEWITADVLYVARCFGLLPSQA